MTNAEIQGKWMILQGKATELANVVRELALTNKDPQLNYFANQTMTKVEEVMHRVGDMCACLRMKSDEAVEEISEKALKAGNVIDMTGKPVV